jgi:hypothetical protein
MDIPMVKAVIWERHITGLTHKPCWALDAWPTAMIPAELAREYDEVMAAYDKVWEKLWKYDWKPQFREPGSGPKSVE